MPWNNKGVALVDLGRYEEAITSFDKALVMDPVKADAVPLGKLRD
jgi:tetratricopeptide (TPR) repeat protein